MTLKNHSRTSWIFIVTLFLLASLVSWRLYFKVQQQKDTIDIHSFPNQIGEWTAREIPISAQDYLMLETRNAFTRAYSNLKGQTFYMFIVYSQDNRKVSHPPEICYTGSGATVISRKPASVILSNNQILRTTKLLVEQGNAQQVAYYWYMAGGRFTPNYWMQQILFSAQNILGRPTSSALIRVSADVNLAKDEWGADSSEKVQEFIRIIFPTIKSFLK